MNEGQKQNRKPIILILATLVIALILTLAFMVNFIRSEANECMKSPVLYGMSKVGVDVSCNCIEGVAKKKFKLNSTDVWWVEEESLDYINFPAVS